MMQKMVSTLIDLTWMTEEDMTETRSMSPGLEGSRGITLFMKGQPSHPPNAMASQSLIRRGDHYEPSSSFNAYRDRDALYSPPRGPYRDGDRSQTPTKGKSRYRSRSRGSYTSGRHRLPPRPPVRICRQLPKI
jgi:hypothetical protein